MPFRIGPWEIVLVFAVLGVIISVIWIIIHFLSSAWRKEVTVMMAESQLENTSSQGSLAVIPQEIRGWNWGAFIFGFWWAVFHRLPVWILLIGFIPGASIPMLVVLGVRGNKWAWQKNKWDSIEHFKRTQRKWAKWGLGVWGVILVIGILSALAS